MRQTDRQTGRQTDYLERRGRRHRVGAKNATSGLVAVAPLMAVQVGEERFNGGKGALCCTSVRSLALNLVVA